MTEPVNEWNTEITSQIERRKAQAEALRWVASQNTMFDAETLTQLADNIERGEVTVGGLG